MSNLFDLEHELERVKHKSIKGFVESKSFARLKSNSSSCNRLLALQQSLAPASLSSAYGNGKRDVSEHILYQYYTLACRESSREQDDPKDIFRTRMIYLLPVYWNAYDPKKAKKLPSHNEIFHRIKEAFEGEFVDKKMFYDGSLAFQMEVWEIFLGRAREKLYQSEGHKLKKDFDNLIIEYEKEQKIQKLKGLQQPKKPKPLDNKEDKYDIDYFGKLLKNYEDSEQHNNTVDEILKEIHPASLAYTYLDWYDDEELDPIISKEVKLLYDALATIVSKSTLTKPKDKAGDPKLYDTAFEAIILALLGRDKEEKKKSSKVITEQEINGWSKEDNKAITKELLSLQAGLGSLYQLLMGGEEVDIKQLQNFAKKLHLGVGIGETGLDILAIVNASYDTFKGSVADNISNLDTGVKNYVTDSAWANSFFAPSIITIGGTIHKIITTDWEKLNLTSVAGKGFTTSLKLAKVSAQGAMFIKDGNKAWGIKPVMETANVSLKVAGIVTGGIGVILNVHVAYKEIKELVKLGKVSERFRFIIDKNQDLKKHMGVEYHKFVARHRIENEDYKEFDVILQKMHHRRSFTVTGLTGAVAGIGSGVTAIVILVSTTLANAWNPVGWAMAITSIVAGTGLLTYKVGKKGINMWRLKNLKKELKKVDENKRVPDFCKTTGDYYRYQAALTIYFSSVAFRGEKALKDYPYEALFRIAVGSVFAFILFGNKKDNEDEIRERALDTAFELGVPGIMGFIKG